MDTVLQTVDGHVATITLNRPDRLNTIGGTLIDDLLGALERVAEDDDVRAVVLTGAGRAFCAGGDLESIGSGGSDPAGLSRRARLRRMRVFTEVGELLHEMPKVTIAAVNGPCAGAGLSFAAACDIRYAARSAIFTTAFAKAGQPGDHGGTWFLPRLIGSAHARHLFFTSERIDAERAAAIGLVAEVVADDELLPHARAAAARIAGYAPVAIRLMKASLNDAETATLAQHLDREADRFTTNIDTDDAREAARAFMEKRAPRFTGR